jgi:hypothetical protein
LRQIDSQDDLKTADRDGNNIKPVLDARSEGVVTVTTAPVADSGIPLANVQIRSASQARP